MRAALVAAAALALAGAGLATAAWSGERAAPTTAVRVVVREFSFTLSRRTVPPGRVRFTVVNRGALPHDFAIGGRKTRLLARGQSAVLTVSIPRQGRIAYRCSVPGHAAAGMEGVLSVAKAGACPTATSTTAAAPTTTAPAEAGLKLTKIGDFERPVLVTAPLGDPHRVFVVEQRGLIRALIDDRPTGKPFLDLTGEVVEVSERGMLSAAFAPDYASSGRFYVDYTDSVGNGNVNVVEYRRSVADPETADPASARAILQIAKPYENHNAGMMQFGPDGNLYVAVGDGDSGVVDPPGAFAQTRDDLLGAILRIDPRPAEGRGTPYGVPDTNPFVAQEGARGEVWDYGLRNPWRFWIDSVTGDLYVGDAGEGDLEEIDYAQSNAGGRNFGWPCFDGTAVFAPDADCPGAVPPVYQYGHAGTRCAVIGGVVVRDPRLPSLAGRYLFGDYCDGKIVSMLVADGKATEVHDLGLGVPTLSSFGVDGRARVYLTATEGAVYRIDPAQ